MSFVTDAHLEEWLDDFAADHPLVALRKFANILSPDRLDACALYEPEAALIYAYDYLTPERRAWCTRASRTTLRRFVPDRLETERRIALGIEREAKP